VRRTLVILPLVLLLFAACGGPPEGVVRGAALVPFEGPLFDMHGPEIRVVFSNATTGRGTLSFTMPDKEKVSGEYSTLSEFSADAAQGTGESGRSRVAVTPEDWKALYGRSDMITGQINGQALCHGDRGTIMQVQYVVDPFDNKGFGVAKDNWGNLYRLRF
jgi:hypothetical protein